MGEQRQKGEEMALLLSYDGNRPAGSRLCPPLISEEGKKNKKSDRRIWVRRRRGLPTEAHSKIEEEE